jgi:hypothetical protein
VGSKAGHDEGEIGAEQAITRGAPDEGDDKVGCRAPGAAEKDAEQQIAKLELAYA